MTRPVPKVSLEIPVIAGVVGFTAIPLALEPFNSGDLAQVLSIGSASDIVTNVLGYVPLGIVLAWRGPWRAIALAAVLSAAAETIQFFSPFRSPSVADFVTNVLGAALGVVLAMRWGRPRFFLPVTTLCAASAAALALAGVAAGPLLAPRALQRTLDQVIYAPRVALGQIATNPDGVKAPGRLEAHWSFDHDNAARISDASGERLDAIPVNHPPYVPGVGGRALALDGASQYAVSNASRAAQITGSMTASAWINPDARLRGDGGVVTTMSHLERGYAFYTTDDEDFRSIAIQLGSNNGVTVTRYGRTELQSGRWYFVAATYDAHAGALHVYVNGRLDDACLLGKAAHHQTVSGLPIHIGRHAEDDIDYFHGAIDEVELYSRALSQGEIAALYAEWPRAGAVPEETARMPDRCPSPPAQDPTSMGWFVIFGELIALALIGLQAGRTNLFAGLTFGLIGGLVAAEAVMTDTLLPAPLLALCLTMAGGVSIFTAVKSNHDTSAGAARGSR